MLENYCKKNGVSYKTNVKLADLCTFKIGGLASLVIIPRSEEEIAGVFRAALESEVALYVLGNGSNVLFSDSGYSGAILLLGKSFSQMLIKDKGTIIECQSGATLNSLCQFACENGLSGLEFAYGIPGTVGGAVYMNAGAYGGEIKDAVITAKHIDPNGEFSVLSVDEMRLSYRHSIYQGVEYKGCIITCAEFNLKTDAPTDIRARMMDYMNRRREKQPLEYPSAGSTFKRPEGAYASALVDMCGLKGLSIGGAQVSEKHAGFLINRGGATADDMLRLIEKVQSEVLRQTGFMLESEVERVGF